MWLDEYGVSCCKVSSGVLTSKTSVALALLLILPKILILHGYEQPSAERISSARQTSGWDGLYFGGTAFKNPKQHKKLCAPVPPECLTNAAEAASRYMDVVTTSGPDTGVPPDQEKITKMRAGCLDTPMCVASGISADNIQDMVEDVDCVFAASSIQVLPPPLCP